MFSQQKTNRLRLVLKMIGALAGVLLLWWLYRSHEDPVGEMVCDMDDIDSDDAGEDVDDTH